MVDCIAAFGRLASKQGGVAAVPSNWRRRFNHFFRWRLLSRPKCRMRTTPAGQRDDKLDPVPILFPSILCPILFGLHGSMPIYPKEF
ncbi:MAG: hypothetical protein ABI614_19620, partial [Planctomycetota bacterium]